MYCNTCKKDLAEEDFYPSMRKKGYKWCKECSKRYVKNYNEKHRKKINETQRKYYYSKKNISYKVADDFFNTRFGGVKCYILNSCLKGEYKYNIYTGEWYRTNTFTDFVDYLRGLNGKNSD